MDIANTGSFTLTRGTPVDTNPLPAKPGQLRRGRRAPLPVQRRPGLDRRQRLPGRQLARRAVGVVTTLLLAAGMLLGALPVLPALAGYQRHVIVSGSMTGTYDRGSVVFDRVGVAHGEGLRPGVPVNGSVTLGSTGAGEVAPALQATPESESAGAGGGRLWDILTLRIADVTAPAAPAVLSEGRCPGRPTAGG